MGLIKTRDERKIKSVKSSTRKGDSKGDSRRLTRQ